MTLYDFLIAPFADYAFMRRALVACLDLGLSCGAFGTFLLLRRMSLMGDALSHAILPGAAIGFLLAGLSLWAMSLGGLVAGIVVAMAAGLISRRTEQREDASLASLYLISLAAGVVLISLKGSALDLMHLLFGNVLAVDDHALLLVAGVSSLSLIILAVIYRPLVAECLDPTFLRALGVAGGLYHLAFLLLIVLNLVAGFQALGTLMAVGLLILPASAAAFWSQRLAARLAISALLAGLASVIGLMGSYHGDWPSGPAVILTAGGLYLLSMTFGRCGSLRARYFPPRHLHHD